MSRSRHPPSPSREVAGHDWFSLRSQVCPAIHHFAVTLSAYLDTPMRAQLPPLLISSVGTAGDAQATSRRLDLLMGWFTDVYAQSFLGLRPELRAEREMLRAATRTDVELAQVAETIRGNVVARLSSRSRESKHVASRGAIAKRIADPLPATYTFALPTYQRRARTALAVASLAAVSLEYIDRRDARPCAGSDEIIEGIVAPLGPGLQRSALRTFARMVHLDTDAAP